MAVTINGNRIAKGMVVVHGPDLAYVGSAGPSRIVLGRRAPGSSFGVIVKGGVPFEIAGTRYVSHQILPVPVPVPGNLILTCARIKLAHYKQAVGPEHEGWQYVLADRQFQAEANRLLTAVAQGQIDTLVPTKANERLTLARAACGSKDVLTACLLWASEDASEPDSIIREYLQGHRYEHTRPAFRGPT